MDKQETIMKVNELPLFHLEKVAVNYNEAWSLQNHAKAVVQNGTDEAIAFVSNRYHLVQFKDILTPVIEGIDCNFKSRLIHNRGVCIMDIFPEMQEFSDDKNTYGISILNSVDRSTGIVIRFNVIHDGHTLSFPNQMAAFVKTHTGKGFKITQDYIQMITTIKQYWRNIVQNLPTVEVTADTLGEVCETFGIKDTNIDYLKYKIQHNQKVTVWDIVEMRLKEISYRNFKSDVHKQKALDNLCNEVYKYAVFAGI